MCRAWTGSWRLPLLIFVPPAFGVISGCQTVAPRSFGGSDEIRAIWVTRWDYKTPRDIRVVMENCQRAGFNTVLFQVRGNGTAFYRSRLEPWADELGGRDPGFDPLKLACDEAHRRGLAIHAWVNVIPGWRGKEPPRNPRQLYHARAGWFWRDEHGRREPLGWYNNLNPCYPEVRRYLTAVMHEIVANYPIDGLHLDYIRFPNEWNAAYPRGAEVPDYPRDPRTLALFRQATGKTPDESPQAFNAWRIEQINRLVHGISRTVRRTRPGVALSAAVGADPDVARREHFQDARRWIAEGWLDAVFPMNYEADIASFRRRLAFWNPGGSPVTTIMGVMLDRRDPRLIREQIELARRATGHFCAFAYNSLFERLDERGRPMMDEQSRARSARRRLLSTDMRLASRTGW